MSASAHPCHVPTLRPFAGALSVLFSLALLLNAGVFNARAQGIGGSITGTVIDATTGKFLEGADVSVEGTNLRVATEREGRFTLRDVPAGSRSIVVSYPGLEGASESLAVSMQ